MKKILGLILVVVTAFVLIGCVGDDEIKVQGVTDTEILIGNTAATSGAFSAVGVPFNQGLEAYLKQVNDKGGVNGRTIRFITYDDEFNADKGVDYTKKLVEEDKVFALVGHFGTPTVGATVDYIEEVGVPMVYAATGINALYFEKSVGNSVLAVQPIYLTDGRIMTSRLLNESVFGAEANQKIANNANIGVLHTTTDDGISIKAGVEAEIAWAKANDGYTGNVTYKEFSTTDQAGLEAAVLELQAAGVSAIVIASNQAPFKAAIGALESKGLHVPVFTSYVNSDATSVDVTINYSFDIYANAWVDLMKNSGADLGDFVAVINAYDSTLGGAAMTGVAYAIAGYIAAKVFVEGLERVGTDELTWNSYISALEEGPIQIPMGGTVDFSGGKRWGIASMSLLKLTTTPVEGQQTFTHIWAANQPIEDLTEIQKK